MSNLKNSVRLMGHLGQAPEIRTTSTGKKVASFSLATSDTFTDANGKKTSETTWHNIVVWGKPADVVEKYLEKGKEVAVEGKLSNRNYIDKTGIKRYITEVIVNEIQMTGSKPKAGAVPEKMES